MEDKIDKLIQGQVEIKTKIEALTEKSKDQEEVEKEEVEKENSGRL